MSQINYINTDCFNYMKTLPDESVDLIVTDPPYGISFDASNHMDNVDWDKMGDIEYEEFLDKLLAECYRVLKPTGTMWMFYGITKIESVIKCINKSMFFNHWENAMVATIPDKTYQAYHLTKNKNNYTFNNIEIKRDVVVPYVVKKPDGTKEKRGWDYENGKAKRWTGLGNCIFASDIDFIIQVLICLSSNENDKVMSSYKRNNSLLYNQVSSSENCSLNFSKRLFLPKVF